MHSLAIKGVQLVSVRPVLGLDRCSSHDFGEIQYLPLLAHGSQALKYILTMDDCTPAGELTSWVGGGSLLSACLEKMFPDSSCCIEGPETRRGTRFGIE